MVGAVILAAGESKRLGQPKQLVPFQGQPLICHVIDSIVKSECEEIVVVLGAYASQVRTAIRQLPVHIVDSRRWSVGKAASIRTGIKTLRRLSTDTEAAIIMTCDQPFVSNTLIGKILNSYRTSGKTIIASGYAGTVGVPALFDRKFFPALLSLKDDEGAKSVITDHRDQVLSVDFPDGALDIDTPDDLVGL